MPNMKHSYFAYGLHFKSDILLSECQADYADKVDFEISTTSVQMPQKVEETNIHRKGICAQSAIDENNNLYLDWHEVATYRALGGQLLEVNAKTAEKDVLSLFTSAEALGLILLQKGYFLLHASAVKVGNEAWVFMGEPGAGKSTTSAAFVQAGCSVLSDDMTGITFDENGKPWVQPAFSKLKVWQATVEGLGYAIEKLQPVVEGVNKYFLQGEGGFAQEPVPLTRFYFLNKGERKDRLLKATEFPIETLKHFPLSNQFLTPSLLGKLLQQSLTCSKYVTGYHQSRPEGFKNLQNWVQQVIQTTKF